MQYASSHQPTNRVKYSMLQHQKPVCVLHKHPNSSVRQVIVHTNSGPDIKNQGV